MSGRRKSANGIWDFQGVGTADAGRSKWQYKEPPLPPHRTIHGLIQQSFGHHMMEDTDLNYTIPILSPPPNNGSGSPPNSSSEGGDRQDTTHVIMIH